MCQLESESEVGGGERVRVGRERGKAPPELVTKSGARRYHFTGNLLQAGKIK